MAPTRSNGSSDDSPSETGERFAADCDETLSAQRAGHLDADEDETTELSRDEVTQGSSEQDFAIEGVEFDGGGVLVDPLDDTAVRRPRGTAEIEADEVAPPRLPIQLEGKSLDQFEILEQIGRGGMGVVYRAQQTNLGRVVAIKVIASGRLSNEVDIARFYGEARAAGRLRHPLIVKIHSIGQCDGYHYFAMDLITGPTLAERIVGQRLTQTAAARMVSQIAEAVEYAHSQGVLHRDLKPANILLDEDDRPHVTDFGLAKVTSEDQGLTATGAALGTPSYMPPEQASGRHDAIGPPSDVYALGAILYELLTGRPPFRAATSVDTMIEVLQEDVRSPREFRPDIDPRLEAVCLKCLAKSPAERYQSAADLAEELQRFLRGEQVLVRRAGPLSRAWGFVRNIPVVAAVMGRRPGRVTVWHTRTQTALLLLPVALIAIALAWMLWPPGMPSVVRIAAGGTSGTYQHAGEHLAAQLAATAGCETEVLATAGSVENLDKLVNRRAELGLVQADLLNNGQLMVVAPLYYECLWILARRDAEVRQIDDFRGQRVAIGQAGSGSYGLALEVLADHGLQPERDFTPVEEGIESLDGDSPVAGALVVVSLDDQRLKAALSSGELRLLEPGDANEFALSRPGLRTYRLTANERPTSPHPPESGLTVLVTPALLVVRHDAPPILVEQTLKALYSGEPLEGRLSPIEASRWHMLPLHPVSRAYFAQHQPD